ncbi:MAG: 2-phospho-L-lactate guanylyltransferase [Nitrososphaerota archaeon]|nr:2-phospho-L-lactate guanylyltransferase [Nitrososphaerota archaeon]
MSLAVIPVKNLKNSKSRLSMIMDDEARANLTLTMLMDELRALEEAPIERIAIVSSDKKVESLAYEYGLEFIYDNGLPLNESLKLASSWALEKGMQTMIILPVDIPLIEAEDIEAISEIISLGCSRSTAVIAPCRRFDGTNLLALKPFNIFVFRFGKDSYRQHLYEAASLGFEVYVYLSETVSLDVDTVDDLLHLYRKIDHSRFTFSFLEKVLKESISQI